VTITLTSPSRDNRTESFQARELRPRLDRRPALDEAVAVEVAVGVDPASALADR
jgi:hypothetical protein